MSAALSKFGRTNNRELGAVTGARAYCKMEFQSGATTVKTTLENTQKVPQTDWERFWKAARETHDFMKAEDFVCTDAVKASLEARSP